MPAGAHGFTLTNKIIILSVIVHYKCRQVEPFTICSLNQFYSASEKYTDTRDALFG